MPSRAASQVHLKIVGQCSRWSDTGMYFVQGCIADDAELTVDNLNKKEINLSSKRSSLGKPSSRCQKSHPLSLLRLFLSKYTIVQHGILVSPWTHALYYNSLFVGFSWMFLSHEPPHTKNVPVRLSGVTSCCLTKY